MPHKDPETARAYQAAYRMAHREVAKRRTAEWRKANPGRDGEKTRRARYREANRERIRQKQREWRERTDYNRKRMERGEGNRQQLKTYGLTEADYDQLLCAQGGVCAICSASEPGMKNAKRLYVDHCHDTKRVRGLLCRACNTMLGCVKDRPDLLRSGAFYLERANGGSAVRRSRRELLESTELGSVG